MGNASRGAARAALLRRGLLREGPGEALARVKQLAGTLPTALRGLKSGKVTPAKVLAHPKLPDQGKVRKVMQTIEGEPRLELNLYIVGENAGEEEGAMAEGSGES